MYWPARVWVSTPDGWAGREVTFMDRKRRDLIERLFATTDPDTRLALERDIEKCLEATQRLDDAVRYQPVTAGDGQ